MPVPKIVTGQPVPEELQKRAKELRRRMTPAEQVLCSGSGHLDQQEYDRQRDQHLKAHGLTVLRFWNNEFERDLEGVLSVILDTYMLQVNGESRS